MLTGNEVIFYGVPGKTHGVPQHFCTPKKKGMHWTNKNGRHIGWVRLLEIKDWKGKTEINKTDLNYTRIAKIYDFFFPFR